MTMLEAMAQAAYEADGDAGIRMPPWVMLSADHPLRTLKISQVVAALKVLRTEVQSIRDAAEKEYPDSLEGSQFEQFTVNVCQLFEDMLKDAP